MQILYLNDYKQTDSSGLVSTDSSESDTDSSESELASGG